VRSGFEAAGLWAGKWLGVDDFAERCWTRFLGGSRATIFDDVLNEFGVHPAQELVSALVGIYRSHRPSISLAGDAREALDEIGRWARIAVITDGPAISQSRKVEALGLCSIASPIVLTAVLGGEYCKPHPKAFERVQQERPADVYLYIGDNPRKDFQAPKLLSWITVRVRRPQGLHYTIASEAAVDHEMADCSGLPEVLRQI
jgi:putative hydrolase of the HAD superfamily